MVPAFELHKCQIYGFSVSIKANAHQSLRQREKREPQISIQRKNRRDEQTDTAHIENSHICCMDIYLLVQTMWAHHPDLTMHFATRFE